MLKSKVFLKKTKRGGVLKIVREHYLRDDIACGHPSCVKCADMQDMAMDTNSDDEHQGGDVVGPDLSSNGKQPANTTVHTLSVNLRTHFSGQPEAHLVIPDTNVVLHQVYDITLL